MKSLCHWYRPPNIGDGLARALRAQYPLNWKVTIIGSRQIIPSSNAETTFDWAMAHYRLADAMFRRGEIDLAKQRAARSYALVAHPTRDEDRGLLELLVKRSPKSVIGKPREEALHLDLMDSEVESTNTRTFSHHFNDPMGLDKEGLSRSCKGPDRLRR
jgi:hypothetical protein